MSSRIRYCLSGLFLFAVFAVLRPVQAGEERGNSPADSTLRVYYKEVKARLTTPEGLAMCDTLYARAAASGWMQMQAIALCLKLDHFYFKNDRTGILEGVERVQEFCRRHGKPEELRYFYYFAWGSRLITYYTKQNQYNVAVYETRRMLAEAQADDYQRGVADCYRQLANLYLVQNAFEQAYENFRREIDVFEAHGIDDINLPTQYASLAQCALELNLPDTALTALRKGRALNSEQPYQRFTLHKASALYYLKVRDFEKARQYVDSAEMQFRANPSMRLYVPGLRFLKAEYYKTTGQYDEALRVVEESLSDTSRNETGYLRQTQMKELGDIYWLMGDVRRSAANYREYIHLSDSVRGQEIRNATDDFSGILEIARLQNETKELQLTLQRKRLRNTYLIIGLLGFVLVLGGLLFARVVKLNRRLKASEALVKAQNSHLVAAGEELRLAKESAERASRMKSDFIQNMSHEVRTPLNSVVGFSQVLASKFRDDPAAAEYASIIVSSSMSLLRLVDDVLNVAYLDQAEELPRTDCTAMNDNCHDCVSKTLSQVRPGVTMIFEPSTDDPVVHTNLKRVMQVLQHLLHNAAKFTVEGEIILTYDCLVAERLMRFTVTDTGPGIPPAEQEAVFERFVKLDAFSQGTGLGLPVCRMTALKLGGSLRIDASYTDGCRMILEVPFDLPAEG
ncbi:MAG: two-component sensor histidine kinase [Alistipes indistinctus]|uniref:sensor histidine kinase n=1 Tax=Alistipes TaxID=239759 RepID=UPI00241D7EBE|nr:ATP-binding protein [Alistipes indistinctus]MBD9128349.1 two-component sensor histidine kinase [Alistipes finegoldii]MBD9135707.1 two-component sensor histidine kinase [Alistipes indistinctus]